MSTFNSMLMQRINFHHRTVARGQPGAFHRHKGGRFKPAFPLLLEELSGGFTEVRKHHFAVVAEGEAEHEVLHLVKVLWLDGRKLIQQKTGIPV
jgi:hypothetical protein